MRSRRGINNADAIKTATTNNNDNSNNNNNNNNNHNNNNHITPFAFRLLHDRSGLCCSQASCMASSTS